MAITIAVAEVFFERGFIVVDGVLERAVVVHRRHYGSGVGLQRQLEAALTGCENGEGRVVRGGEMSSCIRGQQGEAGDVATVKSKLQGRGSRVPAPLSRRDRIAWICMGTHDFSFGQIKQEGKLSGCGWLRKVRITPFPCGCWPDPGLLFNDARVRGFRHGYRGNDCFAATNAEGIDWMLKVKVG